MWTCLAQQENPDCSEYSFYFLFAFVLSHKRATEAMAGKVLFCLLLSGCIFRRYIGVIKLTQNFCTGFCIVCVSNTYLEKKEGNFIIDLYFFRLWDMGIHKPGHHLGFPGVSEGKVSARKVCDLIFWGTFVDISSMLKCPNMTEVQNQSGSELQSWQDHHGLLSLNKKMKMMWMWPLLILISTDILRKAIIAQVKLLGPLPKQIKENSLDKYRLVLT